MYQPQSVSYSLPATIIQTPQKLLSPGLVHNSTPHNNTFSEDKTKIQPQLVRGSHWSISPGCQTKAQQAQKPLRGWSRWDLWSRISLILISNQRQIEFASKTHETLQNEKKYSTEKAILSCRAIPSWKGKCQFHLQKKKKNRNLKNPNITELHVPYATSSNTNLTNTGCENCASSLHGKPTQPSWTAHTRAPKYYRECYKQISTENLFSPISRSQEYA